VQQKGKNPTPGMVTYHHRNALLVCDLHNGLEVGHVVSGVTNALDVDSLGLVVNGSGELLGVVNVDKLGCDAKPREHNLELVVRAAVQVGRRDDVVPGMGQGSKGHELSRLARSRRYGRNTAL